MSSAAATYDPSPLSRAMQLLAGVCDGAARQDGAGFSAFDADFGRKLALQPIANWSPRMSAAAYKLATKYRRQLAGFGLPVEEIPVPPPVTAPAARAAMSRTRVIRYDGQQFVCEFPYDPDVVDAIKKLPGTRFQRTPPAWTVPPTDSNRALLRGFAEKFKFDLDDTAAPSLMVVAAADTMTELRRCDVHPTDAEALALAFPYEWALAANARRFGTWQPKAKIWRVPIMRRESVEEFKAFLSAFGFKTSADAWVRVETLLSLREQTLEESRAVDAELVVDGLKRDLFPFQRAGVRYALKKKRLIIADEMGLGKTSQGIATVLAARAFPCVVVCPASLKYNWQREFKICAPHLSIQVVEGMAPRAFGNALFGSTPDVVILNYDILGPHIENLQRIGLQSLIVDEAHYIKNGKTLRGKWVEEMADGLEWIILLTGTPVLNKPAELIHPLKVLRRLEDLGGSRFVRTRYCGWQQGKRGSGNGAGHLAELNDALRATCYIRRLKSQVLTELPPKIRTPIVLDIDNRAEYERTEADFIEWVRARAAEQQRFLELLEIRTVERRRELAQTLEGHALETELAFWKEREVSAHQASAEERALRAELLVRMESLKQCAAKGLLKPAMAWVRDFLESGEKLVLFATHKDPIAAFEKEFSALTITGATPTVGANMAQGARPEPGTRQWMVDEFQTNPDRNLIVCNLQAGGVGITLTAASNVAFVEFGWTPGIHDQAEDRCHRIGQRDTVNAWYFIARGTIYEYVAAKLDEKRAIVDAATEGGNVKAVNVFGDVLQALAGVTLRLEGSGAAA